MEKLERLHFICDSPTQEYQIHKKIINEDITGIPFNLIRVINSDNEGIQLDINIKKHSEDVVANQLIMFRDFLDNKNLDFNIENLNKIISHTGFKFDDDVEIPRVILGMNKSEILNYNISVADKSLETWKKLYINILKYVIYKQAVCVNYSEYFEDNVYEDFRIRYYLNDYKDFQDMINKMLIDVVDNKVLLECIESVTVFKKFNYSMPIESYTISRSKYDDINNIKELITTDAVISLKQRFTHTDSIEDAEFKITKNDFIASKKLPKNLMYYICELDEKPINNQYNYKYEKWLKSDYFNRIYNMVKPLEEDVEIKQAVVNSDLLNSIKIFGIREVEELKKPEIIWEENESKKEEVYEDGVLVDYKDCEISLKNLVIKIMPYQKQIMEYEEIKDKIKFMTLYGYMNEEITDKELEEYENLNDFLALKYEENSGIDLSGNGEALVAKIRDWDSSLEEAIISIINRAIKVHKLLEENSANLASSKLSDVEIASEINRIVSNKIRMINVNLIQYNEEELISDLSKLSLGFPEYTKILNYIMLNVINSDDVWKSLSKVFGQTKILNDNKKIFINLIQEIINISLIDAIRINNEAFKEIMNKYVEDEIDFVNACTTLNRYIISICLSVTED